MDQWIDTTLVAVQLLPSGKRRVLELPARGQFVYYSRFFATERAARRYLEDQYLGERGCIEVAVEDIGEEQERRKEMAARRAND